MTRFMTFGNRLDFVGDDSVKFQHSLRIPVKVHIVPSELGQDDLINGENKDWRVEFEAQSKSMIEMFQRDLLQQLAQYLKTRTKKNLNCITFTVIIELAKAKDITSANTKNG